MATCTTCPHGCDLTLGKLGLCRSRRGGEDGVIAEGYGRITSLALDPIEKKPIARWRSGTTVLSLGSYGCNMRCPFCQNASIAQVGADEVSWRVVTPQEVVDAAVDLADRRCIGIAYTYNEPLVNWEFLRDTGMLAHEAGLVNVLVSNGMATQSVLGEVARPGTYNITGDKINLMQALSLAGDMTIFGRRDNIQVTREENGKRHIYVVDIRNSDVYNSPAYYLRQNDIIYVEPNKVRAGQSTVNENNFRSVSFWASLSSTVLSIVNMIILIATR